MYHSGLLLFVDFGEQTLIFIFTQHELLFLPTLYLPNLSVVHCSSCIPCKKCHAVDKSEFPTGRTLSVILQLCFWKLEL